MMSHSEKKTKPHIRYGGTSNATFLPKGSASRQSRVLMEGSHTRDALSGSHLSDANVANTSYIESLSSASHGGNNSATVGQSSVSTRLIDHSLGGLWQNLQRESVLETGSSKKPPIFSANKSVDLKKVLRAAELALELDVDPRRLLGPASEATEANKDLLERISVQLTGGSKSCSNESERSLSMFSRQPLVGTQENSSKDSHQTHATKNNAKTSDSTKPLFLYAGDFDDPVNPPIAAEAKKKSPTNQQSEKTDFLLVDHVEFLPERDEFGVSHEIPRRDFRTIGDPTREQWNHSKGSKLPSPQQ